MGERVIVVCAPREARCDELGSASPERVSAVSARLDEARALLEPVGLWAVEPVVALDARLGGTVATSFEDAAREGLEAYPGRPVIFFDTRAQAVPDLDLVLHESTHVWMRAAGANDARWRVHDGRADHQSALVHEGLADFVAAALTGDPILGEGLGRASSLRVEVKCPEGLTGSPHADGLVVSGALWELAGAGRDVSAMGEVLSAVRVAAVEGSRGVSALVEAMGAALPAQSAPGTAGSPGRVGSAAATSLGARWADLVERRGLMRCGEPIAVGQERVSAREGEFLAAGTGRSSGSGEARTVSGPLAFTARVSGEGTAKVMARSSERGSLSVDWSVLGAGGEALGAGRAPLEGWPAQWATIPLPTGSHTLNFRFTSSVRHDLSYNDVRVAFSGGGTAQDTAQIAAPTPPPRSGCAVGGALGLLEFGLPLCLAWFARRRPRR
jgi:hypothetical protein